MIDLLCGHGLTADLAHRVYVESGGIPSLALALCGAIGETLPFWAVPTPLPSSFAGCFGTASSPSPTRCAPP